MDERICIRGGHVFELDGDTAPCRGTLIEDGAILDLLHRSAAGGIGLASITSNHLAATCAAERAVA